MNDKIKKDLTDFFNFLGAVIIIAVSLVVGVWNYLVALASTVLNDGFIGFMGRMESLFMVFLSMMLISFAVKSLKKYHFKKRVSQ